MEGMGVLVKERDGVVGEGREEGRGLPDEGREDVVRRKGGNAR